MVVIHPETIPGVRDMVHPNDYILGQDVSDQTILGLRITMQKYYNGASNRFWAKHNNMGSWPITLVGFGFYFGIKRLGPRLYCKIGAQGPRSQWA